MEYIIETTANNEVIEVTEIIEEDLERSGVRAGIIKVSVPHTTVGIAIKENADPEVKPKVSGMHDVTEKVNQDLHHTGVTKDTTATFVPDSARAKAAVIGGSVNIIINNGVMKLGSRQGIYFYEFDGPRTRKLEVKIIQG